MPINPHAVRELGYRLGASHKHPYASASRHVLRHNDHNEKGFLFGEPPKI